MLLCKFVCDGLNVRVTLQTHHASRRGNRFSCLSLSSLRRVCSRPSFFRAIYRDYRLWGKEKEGRKDDDRAQRNGVSFFSPWQLSLRVIAVGFSLSLSLSLSSLRSRRTILESCLVIQVPSSRELYAQKSPTSEKRRLHYFFRLRNGVDSLEVGED